MKQAAINCRQLTLVMAGACLYLRWCISYSNVMSIWVILILIIIKIFETV